MKTLFLITLLAITVICSGQNRFDKEFKKADSAFKQNNNKLSVWITTKDQEQNYFTIKSEKPKFTICLDQFKVTDTIWITAGKRKVGVPAYKFLDYFKDEPISSGLIWRGGSNLIGL